ncbi:MAG: bifunctional phosphoribosylaminoimidazolecarboxamide formyltransferase/IMP cyclohydrolase [Flavobacteriales bacterium]|nr:bifunctional phosphoribosylaminoimidazolecarboxamide formyltransferase/IMP cyclohydrolase [Flavobacteriales bacterium]
MKPSGQRTLQRALISLYHKEGLEETLELLHQHGIEILSTGGTADWIRGQGYPVQEVESLTGFPSILGGRVKTLHPAIFGGILGRRDQPEDIQTLQRMEIPWIDLVLVDLYPFEETMQSGAPEPEVIEKIDIGGIALIRAAAKNFEEVLVIPSRHEVPFLEAILRQRPYTTREERKHMARRAFLRTSLYDNAIYRWLDREDHPDNTGLQGISPESMMPLRYGENPHQKGWFAGHLNEIFEQLGGKELSYNNLLDLDNGLAFLEEFHEPAWVIIKHNNPCGLAVNSNPDIAFEKALKADEKSAFGGIFLSNKPVTIHVAEKLKDFFFEAVSAPDFEPEAYALLRKKSQRILLRHKAFQRPRLQVRSALHGFLIQERDHVPLRQEEGRVVTQKHPDPGQWQDLMMAWKVVRHTRSNAIVLVREGQMIGVGTGHTSRIDALHHALAKAREAGLNVQGAVLASEAFFPFPDSVERAAAAGVQAIIQPGGSVRDQDSVEACDRLGVAMVFTGFRHFKH